MTAEYSAETCITAGELRRMGCEISTRIPDCGWIPRYSIIMKTGETTIEGDKVSCYVEVAFLEPFQWINLTVEVPDASV